MIDENRHPALLAHIRPAASQAEQADLNVDSKDVAAFVNYMHVDRERRIAKRSPLEAILLVTPLDDDQKPMGEPFLCRTADFSSSGVRIIHTEPIDAKWLSLEHLTPQSDQVRVSCV